jgi:hypothetical protein
MSPLVLGCTTTVAAGIVVCLVLYALGIPLNAGGLLGFGVACTYFAYRDGQRHPIQ